MADWDFLDEVDILVQLPSNFQELRESKKWQERKEALEALHRLLDANPRLSTKCNYGEIASHLQQMLGKEANINVGALAARCITGFAKGLRQKFAPFSQSVFPIAVEKLKEKKPLLREPLIECIDALTATVANLETLQDDIVAGMGKPNPQIKQQVDLYIVRQLNKLTPEKAPKKMIKAIVPVLAKHHGDADADVREAAFAATGSIQRLIGDKNLRSILGDVANDEGKMKKVAEYAEKAASEYSAFITAITPAVLSSTANSNCESTDVANIPTVSKSNIPTATDPWDFLEPFDVLVKLPDDFQTNLESKKWQERRDSLQTFLDLLTKYPRLCPKANYGEIVAQLKKIIEKDANINVAALGANCLKCVSDGLRKKFAPYSLSVVPAILEKFKEKRPLLRDPLIALMDSVVEPIGIEPILEDIICAMGKPNPNIKIQTDLFLYRAFKKLNTSTVPKKTLKALMPLLIKHTSDSDSEVRDASYAALGGAMRVIGDKPMATLLGDIVEDKMKIEKIKEFCQKASEEVGLDVPPKVQPLHNTDESNRPPVIRSGRSTTASVNSGEENTEKSVKPVAAVNQAKVEDDSFKIEPESAPEPIRKGPDDQLPPNNEKQQRLKDERSLKILKWNFSSPTDEHILQLQSHFSAVAKVSLCQLLFSKDFKQHLKACEVLTLIADANPDSITKNSDIILKWCTLRFFETNPAVLIKVLELAKLTVSLLYSNDEQISNEEINSFLPHLLLKTGEQKENMRLVVREIIERLTDICGPSKLCPLIIDALKTKIARQRSECLQILETYVERCGVTPLKGVCIHKAMAGCLSDRDANVRNAAINGLVACYKDEGEQMWRAVGKVADKEKALVEERIKRSGAVAGSAARPSLSVSRPRSDKVDESEKNDTFTVNSIPNTISRNANYVPIPPSGSKPSMNGCNLDDEFPDASQLRSMELLSAIEHFVPKPPVALPPRPRSPLKRTGSSSSISSIDTSEQLEKTIQNISGAIPDVAIAALEQVTYMLSMDDQKVLIKPRMSLVIQAVGAQIDLVQKIHSISSTKGTEIMKRIFNFMQKLLTDILYVDEQALSQWLFSSVCLLADLSRDELNNDDVLVQKKTLNSIILKMCSHCEVTVFFVAGLLCLEMARQLDGTVVSILTKCLCKWRQFLEKNPQPVRLYDVISSASEAYLKWKDDLSLTDLIINSLRTLIKLMGKEPVLDAMRRVNAPAQFVNEINRLFGEFSDVDPNWQPILPPGSFAEELPSTRGVLEKISTNRPKIHIMVDNVIRDLGSVQYHTKKLIDYLQEHGDAQKDYEHYVQKVGLGGMVMEFVDFYRRSGKVSIVTDQVLVSAAEESLSLDMRIERIVGADSPRREMVVFDADPVEEAIRDPGIENIAGDDMALEQTPKSVPVRKRRPIPPAELAQIQARLNNINN